VPSSFPSRRLPKGHQCRVESGSSTVFAGGGVVAEGALVGAGVTVGFAFALAGGRPRDGFAAVAEAIEAGGAGVIGAEVIAAASTPDPRSVSGGGGGGGDGETVIGRSALPAPAGAPVVGVVCADTIASPGVPAPGSDDAGARLVTIHTPRPPTTKAATAAARTPAIFRPRGGRSVGVVTAGVAARSSSDGDDPEGARGAICPLSCAVAARAIVSSRLSRGRDDAEILELEMRPSFEGTGAGTSLTPSAAASAVTASPAVAYRAFGSRAQQVWNQASYASPSVHPRSLGTGRGS
jgi:hypothetical protein